MITSVRAKGFYEELKSAFVDEASTVFVVAAPCSRADRAMLVWALCRAAAEPSRKTLVLTSKPAVITTRLKEYVPDKQFSGLVVSLSNQSKLLVWDTARIDDCPWDECDDCVIMDAHLAPDLSAWIAQRVRGCLRVIGEHALRGTWFRDATEEHGAHRIDAAAAVRGGAITEDALGRIRATLPSHAYAAAYDLQDTETHAKALPLFTFARTRLKVRDKAGNLVPLMFNGRQRAYAALKRAWRRRLASEGRPIKFLVLKYRRGGITTEEQAESYETCVSRKYVQAVTLAHTKEATTQIFKIAQLMHQKDPSAPRLRGVGNAQRLEFPDLNSQFFIGTARASGFGRGDTLQRVHGSEIAKWASGPKAMTTVNDLVAGLTEAASHGEVVLETTANGNEWFAHTYREAKKRQNDWVPIFMPWFSDSDNVATVFDPIEVTDTLDERECELIEKHGLSLAQIAWRRGKVRALRGLFPQEYPEDDESCFLTSGLCYFDVSDLVDLLESTPTYETQTLPGGYYIEWEPPQAGVDYRAGCDTSEGVMNARGETGDLCGVGILRMDTGAQVASLHGSFSPKELAVRASEMCKRYNDALLGVERNNHGHAVLLKLEEMGHTHSSELYYSPRDDRPGWLTDSLSRPVMISELREAIHDRLMPVRDRDFLAECLAFKRQRDGKYSASSPDRDDTVMKWAIAWQMRKTHRGGGLVLV